MRTVESCGIMILIICNENHGHNLFNFCQLRSLSELESNFCLCVYSGHAMIHHQSMGRSISLMFYIILITCLPISVPSFVMSFQILRNMCLGSVFNQNTLLLFLLTGITGLNENDINESIWSKLRYLMFFNQN